MSITIRIDDQEWTFTARDMKIMIVTLIIGLCFGVVLCIVLAMPVK